MAARFHVGLAVGHATLTAVEIRTTVGALRPGRTWVIPLLPAADVDASPLAVALATLRGLLGSDHVTASVALPRPLVQVKTIAVPQLDRETLRAQLARDLRRWFLVGSDAMMVDVGVPAPSGHHGRIAAAVCGLRTAVEGTLETIASAGFEIDRVTAGAVALHAAIVAMTPESRDGRLLVIARESEWSELLLCDTGVLRLVQRVPDEASGVDDTVTRMSACELRPDRVMVVGGRAPVATGAAALPELQPPAEHTPSMLVAFGAALPGESAPMLLTAAMRGARTRASRRRTVRVAVAAAALLITAAMLHVVALRRQLTAMESARRAIGPALAEAMISRRAVDAARMTLETIAGAESDAPRWTGVLASVALALPDSAFLFSVESEGDQIRLSGAAASADALVPALEASPMLSKVSLSAPIRRDEQDGMEHFELTALVTPEGAR